MDSGKPPKPTLRTLAIGACLGIATWLANFLMSYFPMLREWLIPVLGGMLFLTIFFLLLAGFLFVGCFSRKHSKSLNVITLIALIASGAFVARYSWRFTTFAVTKSQQEQDTQGRGHRFDYGDAPPASSDHPSRDEDPSVWVTSITIANMGVDDTGVPGVNFIITNTGKSTQRVYVWNDAFWQIIKTNEPAPKLSPQERMGSPLLIPPNASVHGDADYKVWDNKKVDLENGSRTLYFHMVLIYEDAIKTSASKRYELSSCYVYDPTRKAFIEAPFGNDLHPTDSLEP